MLRLRAQHVNRDDEHLLGREEHRFVDFVVRNRPVAADHRVATNLEHCTPRGDPAKGTTDVVALSPGRLCKASIEERFLLVFLRSRPGHRSPLSIAALRRRAISTLMAPIPLVAADRAQA